MLLKNLIEGVLQKRKDRIAKRIVPIKWWKLIIGIVLISIGTLFGYLYINNARLIFFGMGAAITIGPGILLVYQSFKAGEAGFYFKGKKRYTGRENAIVLFAQRNGDGKKDMPLGIRFLELENPPKGARLHYVRNLKKHFFELYNNTSTKKLEPVTLPDQKSFPPELFKIPAAMQPYKDYMEYSPSTLLQKVAPGILLLAMGIVGLLMVITTG